MSRLAPVAEVEEPLPTEEGVGGSLLVVTPTTTNRVTFDDEPTYYLFDPHTDYSGASAAESPCLGYHSDTSDDSNDSESDKSSAPPVESLELENTTSQSPESIGSPDSNAAFRAVAEQLLAVPANFKPLSAEAISMEREETEQQTRKVSIQSIMEPLSAFEPAALETFDAFPMSQAVPVSPPGRYLEPMGPLPSFKRTRMSVRHASWSRVTNKLQKKQSVSKAFVSQDEDKAKKKTVLGVVKKFFGSLKARRD